MMNLFLNPLGELGVLQRGIVSPLEAHRERSEPCNFRRNCVCHRR